MKGKTVWFDMDGVLFDFDKHFVDLIGKKADSGNNIKDYDLVAKDFFSTMPLLPEGHKLYKKLKDAGFTINILSSTGGAKHGQHEEVKKQKLKALKRAGIEAKEKAFVQQAADKANFRYSKNGILIDDKKKTIDKFKNKGGTAFLFKPQHAKDIYEKITKLYESESILSFKEFILIE